MILLYVLAGLVLLFGFVVFFGAPYVPSLRKEVDEAFTNLYPLSAKDTLVDLGSGDGLVLNAALKHGAAAYGYELNPLLVLISRLRLRNRATIELRNMWSVRLPQETTVVYVFSVSRDSKRLTRYLQAEAARLGRTINVIMFGEGLPGQPPVKEWRGHKLYAVSALQGKQA
jgi:hypothetical protein